MIYPMCECPCVGTKVKLENELVGDIHEYEVVIVYQDPDDSRIRYALFRNLTQPEDNYLNENGVCYAMMRGYMDVNEEELSDGTRIFNVARYAK